MSNRGIQEWYYTRELPSRSVAIAQIKTDPLTPAQLTDINNDAYLQGSLGIWKASTNYNGSADFVAPDLMESVAISGDVLYKVENHLFELTDQASGSVPLYYFHTLDSGVTDVKIINLDGTVVEDAVFNVSVLSGGARPDGVYLFHDMDRSKPFRVRYVDKNGFLQTPLLQFTPAQRQTLYSPKVFAYVFGGNLLNVAGTGTYYIRFKEHNGYTVLPPYNGAPNAPWFPRVRYSLRPLPPEWARQVFLPERPYMLGVWVPGVALDSHIVEFERKDIFLDPDHLPDVLVFDKDYAIKFAIEGTTTTAPRRRGSLYPWKRGLYKRGGVDAYNARVELAVELAPDDIIFGFYSYKELDVIYRPLDVNPFTNPDVKNRVIQFYQKTNGSDPFRYLYHQVLDSSGAPITALTNDPAPGAGTNHVFATMVVGTSVGPNQFEVEDIRVRGGGLSEAYQDIPEAVNFWDLGYWDGKPYPIGGALMVYLPARILDRMSKADVEERVKSNIPMGVLPVIFYYDEDGMESR
jgi:hypothetical protein